MASLYSSGGVFKEVMVVSSQHFTLKSYFSVGPPDKRMEPKNHLGNYLQRVDCRIKADDMYQFVGKKRLPILSFLLVEEVER